MGCTWGYTWHGRYFYHSWLFWLILLVLVLAAAVFLLPKLRIGQKKCPNCDSPVQDVYLRCPDCGHGLKSHCPGCSHIVENSWQFCPHCKQPLHTGAD